MDRNNMADLLGTLDAQSGFLCEIRDLLAARLPVPVEVDRLKQAHHDAENKVDELLHGRDAEVDRLRKENADLRAELDALMAALKAARMPGRWVVRDEFNGSCRDMLRWHESANGCSYPWPNYDLACEFIRAFNHVGCEVINLDDHKETP
jgi:hypothetical protein